MKQPEAKEIPFEILGKDGRPTGAAATPGTLAELVARMMDTAFVIPGTNIRFGLDLLIGLIPGLGDTATSLVSTVVVFDAVKNGVPKVVLARMVLNILLNAALGAIPLVGDALSVWFRSNSRNFALLQRFAAKSGAKSTPLDWLFVFGLLGLVALACVASIYSAWTILRTMFGWLLG